MQRCYHIEYFLLPDDLVPRKLDLVVFGVVAKLFTESNSKVKDIIKKPQQNVIYRRWENVFKHGVM